MEIYPVRSIIAKKDVDNVKKAGWRRLLAINRVWESNYLSCNLSKIFCASWWWKLSGLEAITTNWSIALSF